ncbi:MAG: nucleotidyltransferase family protein [Bdellovibrionales bacterium]|nr:nucleotidyltransferase family protein [Bdellovibrionales bacterium]
MKNYLLVLLAAGESKRFGAIKQLINYQGEPLIRNRVKEFAKLKTLSQNIDIAVVIGAHHDVIQMALNPQKVNIIHNKNWWKGMGSSISAAAIYYQVQQTRKNYSGLIICLVDQVDVQSRHISKLIKKFEKDRGQKISASTYSHTLGAPAIFTNSCIDDLIDIPFAQGAKKFIVEREYSLVHLPEGGRDIDHPEDLKAYKAIAIENPSLMGFI